jgi:hypothetical protein
MPIAPETPRFVHRHALRTWSSGAYSTKASFLSFAGGKVTLRKEDGGDVTLNNEQLRESDQDYVRRLTRGEIIDSP